MRKNRKHPISQAIWLALAAILVIIFGTIYAVVQQSQRQSANSPQIQIAEDAAAALNGGLRPNGMQPGITVNMNTSLAPFVIVYDKQGNVVSGSGYLQGSVPKAPIGILRASDHKPYYSVTWQPQTSVRVAAVTVAAKNYYVLSGRSLELTEQNENTTFMLSSIGGICSEAILLAAFLYSRKKH